MLPLTMAIRWRRKDAALLVCICIIACIFFLDPPGTNESSSSPELHRGHHRRRATSQTSPTSIHSWARNYLEPLTVTPKPSQETILFWHIPKSGGTTAKAIYECLDRTLANRAGALPRFGHDQDKELLAFRPWKGNGATYVNVDTTSKKGILRAQELGLVPSGLADMIFTSDPNFAIEHLYDASHKGRVLGLFRHPVDRLVSKFYYLQVATWERTYRPQWKRISVLEFAEKENNDNDHMVKKLAGKRMNEQATELDLGIAMRTVEQRFVVGLMNQMEESIHRFNVVMGIDESCKDYDKCMDQFFGHGTESKNSNSHPKVEEGSPAWTALAKKNALDVRLYDHIVEIFAKQKATIEGYTAPMSAQQQKSRK